MCIFIGGVQPRKVTVDDTPRMCPSCGLATARLKRLDHYVSLFFIPLFPIKRGETFLECFRCGAILDESGNTISAGKTGGPRTCASCGRAVEPGYSYCPHCGRRQ